MVGKSVTEPKQRKNAGAKARSIFNHTRITTHMWTCSRCTIIMV